MEPTGTNGRTRHTLSDPPWGLGLVLWWFSRWMARNAVSCGHDDDAGKAFDLLASVVRFPDRHDRNRGWFRCRPIPVGGWPSCIGFAVVMAQVRRPVPFRTRKLRPGTAMVLHSRGCGRVARRRIQLSGPSGRVPCGIPGRSLFRISLGGSRRAQRPGNPLFVCCAGRQAGAHCPGGSRRAFPVARRPDYSTRREI